MRTAGRHIECRGRWIPSAYQSAEMTRPLTMMFPTVLSMYILVYCQLREKEGNSARDIKSSTVLAQEKLQHRFERCKDAYIITSGDTTPKPSAMAE